jgi:hypothetical protein
MRRQDAAQASPADARSKYMGWVVAPNLDSGKMHQLELFYFFIGHSDFFDFLFVSVLILSVLLA